jgi:hypothetical protein
VEPMSDFAVVIHDTMNILLVQMVRRHSKLVAIFGYVFIFMERMLVRVWVVLKICVSASRADARDAVLLFEAFAWEIENVVDWISCLFVDIGLGRWI